ncbi:hypothetical protein MTO96_010001 [Rhipicephalus appendiculatus]
MGSMPRHADPEADRPGMRSAGGGFSFFLLCFFLDPAALKNGGGGKQTLQQPLTPSCGPPPPLVDSARCRGRRRCGVHPVRDLRGGSLRHADGRQREGRGAGKRSKNMPSSPGGGLSGRGATEALGPQHPVPRGPRLPKPARRFLQQCVRSLQD